LPGTGASGAGAIGAGETGFGARVVLDVFGDVFLLDGVPAKLAMASDMPTPQSMTAVKMRGLNIPDLEEEFFFMGFEVAVQPGFRALRLKNRIRTGTGCACKLFYAAFVNF
jgi:hypothetical protein